MKYCFDKELLQNFSYKGISKNRSVAPRPSFQKYMAVIDLIFKVIYCADHEYTRIANEEYLQKKFKYVREKGTKRRATDDEEFDVIKPVKLHIWKKTNDWTEKSVLLLK